MKLDHPILQAPRLSEQFEVARACPAAMRDAAVNCPKTEVGRYCKLCGRLETKPIPPLVNMP